MNYGKTIKKIRELKNLSQQDITGGKSSRSFIAKVENGSVVPSTDKLAEILKHLDITFDEFFYVANDYKLEPYQSLKRRFFSLPTNTNVSSINKLKQDCNDLLKKEFVHGIKELVWIVEAQQCLKNNDLETASVLVKPIWERLSQKENWCLSDIRLINSILFVFSYKKAIEIVNRALLYLELYDEFLEDSKLRISLKLNLSALLLNENKNPKLILQLLDEGLNESKVQKNFMAYSVALFRKGVWNKLHVKDASGIEMQEALTLCEAMKEYELRDGLLKEQELYFPF